MVGLVIALVWPFGGRRTWELEVRSVPVAAAFRHARHAVVHPVFSAGQHHSAATGFELDLSGN